MNHPMDQNIQRWRFRRLIKQLDAARGAGTSMISLVIPSGGQISRVSSMLKEEYGTASNIKSQVNKLSVQTAITSAYYRLKLYNRVPPNGLVLFVGTVLTNEGKEKKVLYDFEPHKLLHRSLYLCDNRFHTEILSELLENDPKFGFIIMDGNGCLFGTLSGNSREVLHKFNVDLPKKHGRGGQSALRFSRQRDEKRHNYIRKVAEMALQHFIAGDTLQVAGLVLAGSADFKNELGQSHLLDQRLAAKVLKIVDVSYGGENGFNQAIDLASEALGNIKLVQEKQLVDQYFDEISQDTGKFCFGVEDTLKALELGAVQTLIVWENLSLSRPIPHEEPDGGRTGIPHDQFKDHTANSEQQSLVEWLIENYQQYGAKLELVSDRSQEGAQFVKGFGGLGALLRYRVEMGGMTDDDDEFYDEEVEL